MRDLNCIDDMILQVLKNEFNRLDQLDKTKQITEKFKVFEEVVELASDFAGENEGKIVDINYQYRNASITIECPLFDVIPVYMDFYRRLVSLTDSISMTPTGDNGIRISFGVNDVFEFCTVADIRMN